MDSFELRVSEHSRIIFTRYHIRIERRCGAMEWRVTEDALREVRDSLSKLLAPLNTPTHKFHAYSRTFEGAGDSHGTRIYSLRPLAEGVEYVYVDEFSTVHAPRQARRDDVWYDERVAVAHDYARIARALQGKPTLFAWRKDGGSLSYFLESPVVGTPYVIGVSLQKKHVQRDETWFQCNPDPSHDHARIFEILTRRETTYLRAYKGPPGFTVYSIDGRRCVVVTGEDVLSDVLDANVSKLEHADSMHAEDVLLQVYRKLRPLHAYRELTKSQNIPVFYSLIELGENVPYIVVGPRDKIDTLDKARRWDCDSNRFFTEKVKPDLSLEMHEKVWEMLNA